MEKRKAGERLSEYNSIMKETDEIYREAAKAIGLSDCAFWILYVLREDRTTVTQSQICSVLYQAKQTVNSALKKMQKAGYLDLCSSGDRRSKRIQLTEAGVRLAEKTVDKVIAAEHGALSEMTDAEQEAFIGLFRKYTVFLHKHMQELAGKQIIEKSGNSPSARSKKKISG